MNSMMMSALCQCMLDRPKLVEVGYNFYVSLEKNRIEVVKIMNSLSTLTPVNTDGGDNVGKK